MRLMQINTCDAIDVCMYAMRSMQINACDAIDACMYASGTIRFSRESISVSVPFCTICFANIADNSSENSYTVKGCLSDNF